MTTTSAASRPWSPTDRDRMIFRWIKFEGYKQSWVADQLEINQSTVSRIVQRYERWVAHGGPALEGGLTYEERLRLQRFLTYERNERIIISSLRIAGEMEEHYESSQSTVHRDMSNPSQETQMATTTAVVDRSGNASRYLRLAHRVSMAQLELVKEDDLPALEPLLLDEHEYAQAVEDVKPKYVNVFPSDSRGAGFQPADVEREFPDPSDNSQISNPQSEICSPPPPLSSSPPPVASAPMPAVHNQKPSEPPLTPAAAITSLQISPHKKPILHAFALPQNPPEDTGPADPILDAKPNQPPPPIRIHASHVPLAHS